MKNPHIEACRTHYVFMRKVTGCPPIVLSIFQDSSYYVETKDGSVYIEECRAANSWDAKTECVMKWAELNPKGKS